jgi:hypothetical protein
MYLARTMPNWITEEAFTVFDNYIDNTLLVLTGNGRTELPERAKAIRGNQMKRGGLGVTRIAGIAETAYTSSFLEAMHAIKERCRNTNMTQIFADIADNGFFNKHMQAINKLTPELAIISQKHRQLNLTITNSLIIWDQQQENNDVEIPNQKQLSLKYFDEVDEKISEMLQQDRLGMAWVTSSKYKGSGTYLLPKTCVEIPENQYKALLNLRLLMFPETYIGLSQTPDLGQIGFQCQHCNHTSTNTNVEGFQNFDMGENDEVDLRFHCLNCKSTGNTKHNRHDYIVTQLLILFQSLKMPCKGETQLQGTNHRVDATVNLAGEAKFYIDVNVSNPAARSYIRTCNSDTVPFATTRHSEKTKRNKYAPVFATQQPPISMELFVPFIIETTGRIGEESEKFLKKLKDCARPEVNADYHISKFKNMIWKIVARGNAKCFLDFHRDVRMINPQSQNE